MDWILALLQFFVPPNVADLIIETEGCLFIPILAYGYWRGWWPRLPQYMDRFLGLEHIVKCPHCGEKFEL